MSKGQIVSSSEAAAHGARLSAADVACVHPAPFTADIARLLQMPRIDADTPSAALHAAAGSALGGRRAFVVSPIPAAEDMSAVSYMRLPLVLANVSRPLGAFSIKHDHSDVLAVRDAGWLIFMPEGNQEVIDTIINAYKVCEDTKVLLPAVVSVDMSHCGEPVQVPNEKFTRRYVSRFRLPFQLDGRKQYFAVPGQDYDVFRRQQHRAMKNAEEIVEKTSAAWKKKIGRSLPLVESYKMEDADYALVISGFHSPTAKAAVARMRNEGKKVGLLRLRVLRPWPAAAIKNALKNVKRVAVFDQCISPGAGGILHAEVAARETTAFVSLGKHPSEKDFAGIFARLMKAEKEELVWL